MNVETFSEAVARLECLVTDFEEGPEDLMLWAGLTLRFERAYELSLKILRQRLKLDLGSVERLPEAVIEALKRGFDASDLPQRVDVVDVARLKDDAFKRNLLSARLPLPLGGTLKTHTQGGGG